MLCPIAPVWTTLTESTGSHPFALEASGGAAASQMARDTCHRPGGAQFHGTACHSMLGGVLLPRTQVVRLLAPEPRKPRMQSIVLEGGNRFYRTEPRASQPCYRASRLNVLLHGDARQDARNRQTRSALSNMPPRDQIDRPTDTNIQNLSRSIQSYLQVLSP